METLHFEAQTTEKGLATIDATGLDAVVKNSGLPAQEADEIKSSYLPFLTQLSDTQSQATKINFNNPSELDENIARELRLRTVKIRTAAEKMKEERKRMYLLRGNLEQASYNLIASSCKLVEEVFFNVEKAREIAEKKRKEDLKRDRAEKLSPYTEDVALYPLGEMSEDQFSSLYATLRASHERQIEEERKAEAERQMLAAEKALHEERKNSILDFWQFTPEDKKDSNFGTISEKDWNDFVADLKNKKAEHEKEQECIRRENERLAEEAKKKQEQLEAQQAKAKAEAEAQKKIFEEAQVRAEAERKALIEKAEKEQAEKKRIEAELKAKLVAEEKAKKDEERRKKDAEKKARLAPDKDKLIDFAKSIDALVRPEIKAIEAATIIANANSLLCKVRDYIIENASKL